MKTLVDKLSFGHSLTKSDWIELISSQTPELSEYVFAQAREVRDAVYGHEIYIRGLIEFTNYCRNDCYYCGIRKSNQNTNRFRLTPDEILSCCQVGYDLGFRTFVLQGGEDGYFTDERLIALIRQIKKDFPACAVTLSAGEKSHDSYQALFEAGADRYLLRHETASISHYQKLHPASLSASHRQKCLYDLKEIGYQTGAGMMIGSPYQTAEHLAEDMLFLKDLMPHMIGIYPSSRYPVCQRSFRYDRANIIHTRSCTAYDPGSASSGYYSTRRHPPGWKRTRHSRRSKCNYA